VTKHWPRLIASFVLALSLVAIAVLFWVLHRHASSDLREGATRIASTQDWPMGMEEAFLRQAGFLWLDGHTVFHFTGDTVHGYQAVGRDMRTQRETPLPPLTVTQTGLIIKPSPDGRWVFWVENPRAQSVPVATAVDGSATVRWPRHWYNDDLAWTPDSKGWVWGTYVPTGRVSASGKKVSAFGFEAFRVDRPGVRQIPLATPSGMPWILGCTATDRVLVNDGAGYDVRDLHMTGGLPLVEYALGAVATPVRTFSVPVPGPPDAQDMRVRLSPQGDRLLWCFQVYHVPPLAGLGRLLHVRPLFEATGSLDVWVSQVDGSRPRHIGALNIGSAGYLAEPVEWTPDGRCISFDYDSVLWTKPVD
jgi:hypothetical protein